MEKWTNDNVVYDGHIFRIRTGEVVLDDGTPAQREIVEHPGGVAVVPFTGHSVLFVLQYRIAVGRFVLEIPAGKREGNEPPEACGMRELVEETGYTAGHLVSAGSVYASVGYCSELIHLFLAFDLKQVGQNLDHEERIEIVEMPLDEARSALHAHRFDDAKTVVGLHALMHHLACAS